MCIGTNKTMYIYSLAMRGGNQMALHFFFGNDILGRESVDDLSKPCDT